MKGALKGVLRGEYVARWGTVAALYAVLLLNSGTAFAQDVDTSVADAVAAIDEASCWLLYFTEGTYGMLLTGASMLGAVVATAYGANRAALQALVVAIASFLIGPTAMYFFDHDLVCDAAMFIAPGS